MVTVTTRHRGPGRTVPGRGAGVTLRLLPLVPATLVIGAFFLLPIIWAGVASTTDLGLTGSKARNPSFIGLENYTYLFTDPRTWEAVGRTLIFVIFSVLGQNAIGFAIAYAKQGARRWVQSVITTVVIIAWVIPEVVAAFLWYTFLKGDNAGFNQILTGLGLPAQEWLVTAPLFAVIVINIWRGSAFSLLVYSAALQDIPGEVIEAAQMDGAGTLTRIRRIVIPMLSPVIASNMVLTTLNTLGVFGLIWITTAGGPGTQSETLAVLMYNQAYNFGLIGYGSAIAVLLLALGVVFSVVYVRVFRSGDKRG